MLDNIIVGAGLSGVVIAERIATQLNKKIHSVYKIGCCSLTKCV